MASFINRLVFIKMRRIFELLTLTLFVIIVVTIGTKWSSTTINDNQRNFKFQMNPFLPKDPSNDQLNMFIEKPIHGRLDLPKYIHLDLKGAPPHASKFYEPFFDFIDKLQMGVKGFLIEYEDMLPLKGRFINVSEKTYHSIDKMKIYIYIY